MESAVEDAIGDECLLHGVHHHHHAAKAVAVVAGCIPAAAAAAQALPTMTDEADALFHCHCY